MDLDGQTAIVTGDDGQSKRTLNLAEGNHLLHIRASSRLGPMRLNWQPPGGKEGSAGAAIWISRWGRVKAMMVAMITSSKPAASKANSRWRCRMGVIEGLFYQGSLKR